VSAILGVPDPGTVPTDSDVVVIGLGTRTAPRERAVADSLAAASALSDAGIHRWYQKYCSTFDSTDDGMIGPIAEALVDAAALARSLGTPATPHSDRTVYRGHLFVGDRLLNESPLAHHPLTPMTDPDLVRVLGRQTTRPVTLVDLRTVHQGADAVAGSIAQAPAGHVLADALDDGDLDTLAAALDETSLPGGGAGLMTAIGRTLTPRSADGPSDDPVGDGPGIVLAGSASAQTRAQLAAAGGATVQLDTVRASRDPAAVIDETLAAIASTLAAGSVPIVSAGHDPASVAAAQSELGTEAAAHAVEHALAEVARRSVHDLGVRRLLIAGGETSGAVTRALGVRAMTLRQRVDPGVAWATGRADAVPGRPAVALLLKSGNFGGIDLFTRAWELAP
jgi:uncharacterized protein YgbK (DUF1537 family)